MSGEKKHGAVVTGATRGIGRQIVYKFAEMSYDIAFCARDEEECNGLLKELKSKYPGNTYFARRCDVSDSSQADEFLRATKNTLKNIDVLVNNAGVGAFRDFGQISAEEWERLFAVNALAPVSFCRKILPLFLGNEGAPKGIIFNIGSSSVTTPVSGNIAYASSKAALKTFSENLFYEYRKKGICVTYLSPGSVDTGFSSRFSANADWKIRPADVAQTLASLAELMFKCNICIPSADIRTMTPIETKTDKE